ncbi:MAG: acyl carrier protein [Desulfobacteraceae bacterium]
MEISAAKIFQEIEELFPECRAKELSLETVLGEMPEWDSMAAVNLQTLLLQQYEIEVPLELLADETSLKDVIAFLESPEIPKATY